MEIYPSIHISLPDTHLIILKKFLSIGLYVGNEMMNVYKELASEDNIIQLWSNLFLHLCNREVML